MPNKNTIDEFMARTRLVKSGCIEWTGNLFDTGYGSYWIRNIKRNVRAHRWIFEKTHKLKLTSKQFVCHKCDNRKCVNVDHLFLGDAVINKQDCIRKGRAFIPTGSKHGNSKLTIQAIKFIRDVLSYNPPPYSLSELGRMFEVHDSLIAQVRDRKIWKHVK